MRKMYILFIGDIFGRAGRKAVLDALPVIRDQYPIDIVIANGENVAGGNGVTRNLCTKLFRYGVDVITTGNHVWDREEAIEYLDEEPRVLRPINFPPGTPGNGSIVYKTESGIPVGIVNGQGRVFMKPIDDPFRTIMQKVEKIRNETSVILVDFHAEATSEKIAMAYYLDGKVSAVLGTHTHVQTADNRVLSGGTAALTDAGMTGPHDSVIGIQSHLAVRFLLTSRYVRFEPARENIRFQGAIIEVDEKTGKAVYIERVNLEIESE